MSEGDHELVAFAILVLATLLVLVAAVIALIRSKRPPGLTATSSRAVEEVAAQIRMNRSAMLQQAAVPGRSATSRPIAARPPTGAMLPSWPRPA